MVKIKQSQNIYISLIILLILLITVTIIAIYFYIRLNKINNFLEGISKIKLIRSYDQTSIKKLVYYSDIKTYPKILLTNNNLDPESAKEILSKVTVTDFKESYRTSDKKNYFFLQYP